MHSNLQQVHDIATICSKKGITKVVLSPGSRCAPITVSFARHPSIETFVVPDERSAAFIAMGMALETKETVAIVCTSGTASINYYPAITEAYYQQIPLLVLTADRPPELVDQGDGQTIRQENLYKNHIKASFSFPIDSNQNSAYQLVADAINETQKSPKGPVHINIPIREPFYPSKHEALTYSDIPIAIEKDKKEQTTMLPSTDHYKKVLLVAGQAELSLELKHKLNELDVPIICESIANLHGLKNGVFTHDLLLSKLTAEEQTSLKPDLLITFGNAVLSKALKQYLRANNPITHWSFSDTEKPVDVFQSITDSFPSHSITTLPSNSLKSEIKNEWISRCRKSQQHIINSLNTNEWNEFSIIYKLIQSLPSHCTIHVANSMSIRYVNYLTFLLKPTQVVRCNRGTSGIDGSISTAVGCAITSPEKLNFIITGDLSFFYDRNGLWHNHLPKNLRILLMNNHGGGIFRMIDGPANLPEHEIYFETPQHLSGKNTANDFNLEYSNCKEYHSFETSLKSFVKENGTSQLLEVETSTVLNTAFFKQFKQTFNSNPNE